MPCFHPVDAWYHATQRTENGKKLITHDYGATNKQGADYIHFQRPCGQCSGCRLRRSAEWATRCMHEASLYKKNCFITLTYSPENLPEDRSLNYTHYQLFMKRLRKKYGENIRFYMCGEYGEQYGRPHYHAIIFNFDFPDKQFILKRNGFPVWRSPSLEELWTLGNSEIGAVSFESAAYVARYIMKKHTGKDAQDHYMYIDPATGQIFNREPEFTKMSLKPGIAFDWFEKFHTDVYPHDYVIIKGRKVRPPKFYDHKFSLMKPFDFDEVKFNRYLDGMKNIENNTPERLKVREAVLHSKLKQLPRNLD